MAESLTLTNPEVVPEVSNTFYRVGYLLLDWDQARIVVHLRGQNLERKEFRYEGSEATTLMTILNTANLSTTSLHKRVLNKLIADGKIAGTVTGTPD